MADGFDRARFESRLRTRRLGRTLVVRDATASTNDDVWDGLAAGAAEGFTVIADTQTAGRGRLGRRWHTAPGRSLALSVALVRGCEAAALPATPLLAGLALHRALAGLGVAAELKWPNDLLLGGCKVAGLLVESRGRAPGGGDDRAVVVGAGVNVSQSRDEFPDDLRALATSLAEHGHSLRREDVAAGFLDALEPLWDELERAGREPILRAWRDASRMWGRAVAVTAPGGTVRGIARDVDGEGRLVVEAEDGARVALAAGDVTLAAATREGDANIGGVPGAARS